MNEKDYNDLRLLAVDTMNKSLYPSAAFIIEKVTSSKFSTIGDYILHAKCFYQSGEVRRCLATLEQKSVISAFNISKTHDFIIGKQKTNTDPSLNFASSISSLEGILLAAQCLFKIEQFTDSVSLLLKILPFQGLDGVGQVSAAIDQQLKIASTTQINVLAGGYCLLGKGLDVLEKRKKAILALKTSLFLDVGSFEALDYLLEKRVLTELERTKLYLSLEQSFGARPWMESHYRTLLLSRKDQGTDDGLEEEGLGTGSQNSGSLDATALVRRAERLFEERQVEEAYRLAKASYSLDPFFPRGVVLYVSCLVELRMHTELFYLSHELVQASPKDAVAWFCVGAYYFGTGKYTLAQKYLLKVNKIDKRFYQAWILLGHTMGYLEEAEQAISAYRTAMRLLPGDHKPMLFLAQELIKTNYLSLALHILLGAKDIVSNDPRLFNELAIIHVKLDKLDIAVSYFQSAIEALEGGRGGLEGVESFFGDREFSAQLYSNFGNCLRKKGFFNESLVWLDRSLSLKPNDPDTHVAIAFSLHLLKKFDLAINFYHQALSIQPEFVLCLDLLNKAMEDSVINEPNSQDLEIQNPYFSKFFPPENHFSPYSSHIQDHTQDKENSGFSNSRVLANNSGVMSASTGLDESSNDFSFSRVAGNLDLSSRRSSVGSFSLGIETSVWSDAGH